MSKIKSTAAIVKLYGLLLIVIIYILVSFISEENSCAQTSSKQIKDDIDVILDDANSLIDEQKIDSAIAVIKGALKLAEDNFGAEDTTTIQIYHKLGLYHYFNADYENAEQIWLTTLRLRTDVFGELHTDVALSQSNLGIIYYDFGDYEKSEKYHLKSLQTRRKLFGSEHEDVAASLNNLGNLYCAWSKYPQAESLFSECLEIRNRILEPDDPNIAITLNNLANVYSDLGRYSEAELLYEKTLDAFENSLGPDHPYTATCLNNLAVFYSDLGKFTQSEVYHKRALRIRLNELGEEHPDAAHSMNNLAALYWSQGKYNQAETLYISAIEIWEKTYGPQSHDLARSMNNLADIYRSQGKYNEAERLLNEALLIRQTRFGEKHGDVALSYNKLSVLSLEQGLYQESKNYSNLAYEICVKLHGNKHPETARSLYNLASANFAIGAYEEAKKQFLKVLDIRENYYGLNHPDAALTINQLAKIYASSGNYNESLNFYKKFQKSRQEFIEYAFASVSEDQKMKYMHDYPVIDYSFLSYALSDSTKSSHEMVFEMVLKGKALIIDALSDEREHLYTHCDSAIIFGINNYNKVCSDIANLTITGSQYIEPDIYRNRLKALYASKDSLESFMSTHSTKFREDLKRMRFNVNDIVNKIPKDCLLMEIIRYKPYDFSKFENERLKFGRDEYLAFTCDSDGNIDIHNLGDAVTIDTLVTSVRNTINTTHADLYSSRRQVLEYDLNKKLNKLYNILITPIASDIKKKASIIISPDGQLNLLPFEIIQNNSGEYLIEQFQISYVSSGRDLFQFTDESDRIDNLFIAAAPDYKCYEKDEKVFNDTMNASYIDLLVSLNPIRSTHECLNSEFTPLPYTLKEIETIVDIFNKEEIFQIAAFSSIDATEDVIKRMDAVPDVLHLSTHGYFCENRDNFYDNPLLKGGLAFSGANCVIEKSHNNPDNGEDGILTALEVTGLNLVGTHLVVLSACETGIGEVENSEGVYGLRRSFQQAGAETIIMSLWKVPDKETFEIMEGFYKQWLSGKTKQEALRLASLDVLKKHRKQYNSSHPYFWGGFILSGNPY